MAKKQTEYSVAIRIAGMVDPSYTKAVNHALSYAKQFQGMDAKGRAKEIGILAAGKAAQLAGKALHAGARLAAAGMRELFNQTKISIEKAVEFETAMIGVKKVTSELQGETKKARAEYEKFSESMLVMSRKSIYTAPELIGIAEQGARGGIAYKDLQGYVDLAQTMGIAYNSDADTAGAILRDWSSKMGLTMSTTENGKLKKGTAEDLADAINRLGNRTNSDSLAIAKIVTEIGPLASMGGTTYKDLAAIASVLGAGGFSGNANKMATSMKNMMLALNNVGAGGKLRQGAFESLGLSGDAVAKMMQKDSTGTIIKVLQGIQSLSKDKQLQTLGNLFGKQSSANVGVIAKNIPNLIKALEIANENGEKDSIRAEKDIYMQGTGARYKAFQNQKDELHIRFGSVLLPGLNAFMDAASEPLAEISKDMAGPVAEMGKAFGETIGVLAKDEDVKNAFKELAMLAPEILKTLCPAIPPLAKFTANLVTAVAPLSVEILKSLVESIILLEPVLTGAAKLLAGFFGSTLFKSWKTINEEVGGTPMELARQQWNERKRAKKPNAAPVSTKALIAHEQAKAQASAARLGIKIGGGNADGAVYTKPTTLWGVQHAEREPEGVFPLSYLNKLLGGRGGGESYNFTYAPKYTVGPGTDMKELKKTDAQQQQDFERRMDRWMAKRKRLNFAH